MKGFLGGVERGDPLYSMREAHGQSRPTAAWILSRTAGVGRAARAAMSGRQPCRRSAYTALYY